MELKAAIKRREEGLQQIREEHQDSMNIIATLHEPGRWRKEFNGKWKKWTDIKTGYLVAKRDIIILEEKVASNMGISIRLASALTSYLYNLEYIEKLKIDLEIAEQKRMKLLVSYPNNEMYDIPPK